MVENSQPPLTFRYRNHRGEVAVRQVIPRRLEYRASAWHAEEQWLLIALDVVKNEERDFSLDGIIEFMKT